MPFEFKKEIVNNNTNKMADYDWSHWEDIFSGTPYYDQFLSIKNQYGNNSPVENLVGAFTGKNAENRYNHIMSMEQALLALQNTMFNNGYNENQLQEQREYDSPANQAKLMQDAGLNADLLGVGSSGLSPNKADAMPAGSVPQQEAANGLKMFGDFISMASNAASFIIDAKSKGLDNSLKGLALENALDDRVITDLSRFAPEMEEGDDLLPAFKMEYNTGNKRLDKRLNSRVSRFQDSMPVRAARYRNRYDVDSARKDLFDVRSSAGFSDDDENFLDFVASEVANMQLEFLRMQKSSQTTGFSNDSQVQTFIDNILHSETDFMKKVRERAEKGGPLANMFLIWLAKSSQPSTTDFIDSATNVVKSFGNKSKKH